ncbi:SMC-Scp complex subunit ScpB [Aquihabitans sp. G128]|uniref:SMC-Scp complex subunit ScpB n=1 Tax=Aquihabitans sp. G128 TaxID=2849779 RepID=UPI001C246129|nr:SMC-Scp complex subunit ScpB [Aquihabitans sp. G128]QXC62017.1 SMC-Scp complex subunit ScpB [Aquihabitans sp. G128]
MASEAEKAIEAILMVAQEPVDPHLLAQVLEVSPARVEELCAELAAGYEAQDRGFVLVKVAGGYRFQSHGHLSAYVERFVLEGQSARLSAAALETLAIVAYKQPMSRAQVAAIRGVNVDGVMRTLQQRGYVTEVGRDPGPGQATLFGTSDEFLERLGLASIADLPPIADLFPSADIMEALEKGLRAEPLVPHPVDRPTAAPGPVQGSLPTDAPEAPAETGQAGVPGSPIDEVEDAAAHDDDHSAAAPAGWAEPVDWSEPDDEVEPLPEPGFMADAAPGAPGPEALATPGSELSAEVDLLPEADVAAPEPDTDPTTSTDTEPPTDDA